MFQVVGLSVAGGVCRHVGEHHVGRPAKHGHQRLRRRRIEKIELHEIDAGDRVHRQNIDRHDAALARRADAPGCHLAPAAGRGAEVDDPRAFLQQFRLVVDLGQLISRARAKPFALGADDVRIVELALKPLFG